MSHLDLTEYEIPLWCVLIFVGCWLALIDGVIIWHKWSDWRYGE